MQNYIQKLIFALILFLLISYTTCTTVVVNGGQVTLSGAVTQTQIDLMLTYTANVKWIALIWGPDQVNTDAHLFIVDQNNAANPVLVKDCYINQLSYIVYDDVNSIQPSITSFPGDISNGIKAAYNRDLSTGDSEDIRLYTNSVVQVCFISSNSPFQGNGYEKGHEKICSFVSLHQGADDYYQDRLLGNYAGTSLLGGGNLTFYATQSTDGWNTQSWLFMSVVHKQQGLNPFTSRWIGVSYLDSLTNIDMAMLSQQMLNFKLEVHTRDMFAQTSISAKQDDKYNSRQGSNDVVKIYGAYDSTGYFVASYKRKFSTGDSNRDTQITSGENEFCFIYGNSQAFSTFTQSQRVCLNFTLKTNYYSNFRVIQDTDSNQVIEYTQPKNKIVVIKKFGQQIIFSISMVIGVILFLIFM